MDLRVNLIRPDDLLNLQVEGVNLRLDASEPTGPVLVPVDAQQPSYLIYHFPPQTTAEEAFFEQSAYQPKGLEGPDLERLNKPVQPPTPVKPPGDAAARLGGPARLVFRVPGDAPVPFTTEGLLDWSTFGLQVTPIADVLPGQPPPDAALTVRPPDAIETTIELPYRLHLSPAHNVVWDHTAQVVAHDGRAELWHTRLASRTADGGVQRADGEHTLPLRAIWSPDYDPSGVIPSPGDFGPLGELGAMSPYDRHQIVVLSSAFAGYAANSFKAYTPLPLYASQLMLSALGGWLRSTGMWDPPYRIKPRLHLDPLEWGNIFDFIRIGPRLDENVQRDIAEMPPGGVAEVDAPEQAMPRDVGDLLMAHAIDMPAAMRPGIHEIAFAIPRYNLGQQLDLSQWAHVASQGRDHYVRIVYEGKLKWPGHRASLIKVTERRFEPDPQTGAPVAYLRQFMYIIVREPEKTYEGEGLAHEGRGMLLRKIRLTTLVTPKIDMPYNNPLASITDRSFWVMVGNQDLRFHALAEDVDGNQVDFTTPLIFVPNSEQKLQQIHDEFIKPKNSQRRAARVAGQKVTFALSAGGKDNTSFATQVLDFVNEGPGKADFFKPKLFKADVRIPAVEQLVGAGAVSSIRYFDQYLAEGFDVPANATGVFAEIVKENSLGVLEKARTGVEFAAEQAGGFATPNLDITVLTRDLGPLGGDVQKALTNDFNPQDVFKKGMARLFGSFDLADLIPAGKADQDAPKMLVRREGTTAIAELDWQPRVQDITNLVVIEFHRFDDTKFIVHGVFKKNLGAATKDEFTLTGDLKHFNILFFKVLQVNFASFFFKAQSGRKTDVNVKLDDSLPVQFMGDLEFVEGLRKLIPPGVFGDGVSIDLISNPLGVKAGLAISLLPAAVGVFASGQNIMFAAGLTIPFLEGKPIVNFAFARRDSPFLLTVAFLGGGGFFGIEIDPGGIRMLEAAFEFGAVAALNLGVASGEVHIMAGIYFKMEKKVVPELGNKEVMVSLLTGYLRCGGKLSVLGIISISVEFNLSFTYDSGTEKASGRATLSVTVEIAFFSTTVDLTVERSFGAKGGDPTFGQLMDSPAVWSDYSAAFA